MDNMLMTQKGLWFILSFFFNIKPVQYQRWLCGYSINRCFVICIFELSDILNDATFDLNYDKAIQIVLRICTLL